MPTKPAVYRLRYPTAPHETMSLPVDFVMAIGEEHVGHEKALKKPFSTAWLKAWESTASEKGQVSGDTGPNLKLADWFPQAKALFTEFRNNRGIEILQDLFRRGATDPNFVLRLLIQYYWNGFIPRSGVVKDETKLLNEAVEAIAITKEFYDSQVKSVFDGVSDQRHDALAKLGAEPSVAFEKVIMQLRALAKTELDRLDGRNKVKGQAPNDKANRVIFTIYEYVRQATGSPHWATLLELCVAAKLVKKDVWKNRSESVVSENPDGRLRPHIDSFRKHHPKEAKFISSWLVPTIHPIK